MQTKVLDAPRPVTRKDADPLGIFRGIVSRHISECAITIQRGIVLLTMYEAQHRLGVVTE